jgi:hypothetical protein
MQVKFISLLAFLSSCANAFSNFGVRALLTPLSEPFLHLNEFSNTTTALNPYDKKENLIISPNLQKAFDENINAINQLRDEQKKVINIFLYSRVLLKLIDNLRQFSLELEQKNSGTATRKNDLNQLLVKTSDNPTTKKFLKTILTYLGQKQDLFIIKPDDKFNYPVGYDFLLDRYEEAYLYDKIGAIGTASMLFASALAISRQPAPLIAGIFTLGLGIKLHADGEANLRSVEDRHKIPRKTLQEHINNQKLYQKLVDGLTGKPKKLVDAIFNSPEYVKNLDKFEYKLFPYKIFEMTCRQLFLENTILDKTMQFLDQPEYLARAKLNGSELDYTANFIKNSAIPTILAVALATACQASLAEKLMIAASIPAVHHVLSDSYTDISLNIAGKLVDITNAD